MRSANRLRAPGLPAAFWAAIERARAASDVVRHLNAAAFSADVSTRGTLGEIAAFHRGRRSRALRDARSILSIVRRPFDVGVGAHLLRNEAASVRRSLLVVAYAGVLSRRRGLMESDV